MKTRLLKFVVLCLSFSLFFSTLPVITAADNNLSEEIPEPVTDRSYYENLLIRYKVIYFIDNATGQPASTILEPEYKNYVVPHGYTYTETVMDLEIPSYFPLYVYSYQEVTRTYDIY